MSSTSISGSLAWWDVSNFLFLFFGNRPNLIIRTSPGSEESVPSPICQSQSFDEPPSKSQQANQTTLRIKTLTRTASQAEMDVRLNLWMKSLLAKQLWVQKRREVTTWFQQAWSLSLLFFRCLVWSVFQIKRSFVFFMPRRSNAGTFVCTYGSGISEEMHEVLKFLQLSFKVKAQTKAKKSHIDDALCSSVGEILSGQQKSTVLIQSQKETAP